MVKVGLEVHEVHTQTRMPGEDGGVMELRFQTERERDREIFGSTERGRILLEVLTESAWVARCLEELGLQRCPRAEQVAEN